MPIPQFPVWIFSHTTFTLVSWTQQRDINNHPKRQLRFRSFYIKKKWVNCSCFSRQPLLNYHLTTVGNKMHVNTFRLSPFPSLQDKPLRFKQALFWQILNKKVHQMHWIELYICAQTSRMSSSNCPMLEWKEKFVNETKILINKWLYTILVLEAFFCQRFIFSTVKLQCTSIFTQVLLLWARKIQFFTN